MIAPPSVPSALLVVGDFDRKISSLHLVPEDGTIERFGQTMPPNTILRYNGAKEVSREQIGKVTIYHGDGERLTGFLDDMTTRVCELWNSSISSSPTRSIEVSQLVQDVLRPVAVDAVGERKAGEDEIHEKEIGEEVIREKKRRQCSTLNATETYGVYIIRITRRKAGKILPLNPTSFADSWW